MIRIIFCWLCVVFSVFFHFISLFQAVKMIKRKMEERNMWTYLTRLVRECNSAITVDTRHKPPANTHTFSQIQIRKTNTNNHALARNIIQVRHKSNRISEKMKDTWKTSHNSKTSLVVYFYNSNMYICAHRTHTPNTLYHLLYVTLFTFFPSSLYILRCPLPAYSKLL